MKKLFTLAVAVLASFSLWAADPSETLDVAEAASTNDYYQVTLDANVKNTAKFFGYNSSGSGSSTGCLKEEGYTASMWKINSSRTVTFKVKNCSKIFLYGEFLKDATETISYKVGDGDATAFLTNGSDKKICRGAEFEIGTSEETLVTISANNDFLLGYAQFYPASTAPVTDSVKTVTVEGPTAGIIGKAVTYTATTDVKATNYKWYLNGAAINGETNKKLEYTPMAAGKYIFSCRAWNENNLGEGIMSNYLTLNVTDPAKATGEIIKAELTSGTAATVTGVIGGTADVSLSSSKKLDKNKYFGITLAAGNFREGDTVVITMTTVGSNYPCLFADKERTNCLFLATEVSKDLEYRIVLPAAANSINTLYVSRGDESDGYKWNPVLSSMSVIRPIGVKSKVEELINVKVNGTAISAANLNDLKNDHSVSLDDQYAKAPVVTYTKKVTTTYDDESVKIADVDVEVTAEFVEANNVWEAEARINDINYRVIMQKAASYTVTYKDGETVLGTEIVAVGGHPAEYAQYQSMSLATFEGWYREANLEEKIEYIEDENINEDVIFYAKFVKAYAQSINIEKAVMQNGKGYAIIPQLGTLKYASNITGSLDSLAVKDDGLRNYAYLGLKVKQAGALLNFRLAKGSTVKVKFGNVGKTPLVSINGGEYAEMTITDKVYSYTAEEEAIVSIKTADGSAVVFQQIMINEDIQAPELFTITCAAAEHGTVSVPYKMGIPGEVIKLSFTMDEGYTVTSCYANDVEVVGTAEGEFFTMPAANVTITATFGDETTAIDNTNAELKAVKVIENGQIFIIKNGVKYNAQGAVVR